MSSNGNNQIKYSIGNNNIIKIRIEDSSDFTLNNNKKLDTTKITSNHTTLRELDEDIGVVQLDIITNEDLINEGKYKIKVTYSDSTEIDKTYKYLKEEKDDYDSSKPTILIDTMGRIYFNSLYKNFKDEYYKEFCIGKRNGNSTSYSDIEIYKKNGRTSFYYTSSDRTSKDMNNLIMMLIKLANLKEEYKDNFKIINKYSEMWGETYLFYPNPGEAFFTNYQKNAGFAYHGLIFQSDINTVLNEIDILKYNHEGDIEEELYLPIYFNGTKIIGLGSLYFIDSVKTIIVPETYKYLGTPNSQEKYIYPSGNDEYTVFPFTNITAGTRVYANGNFYPDYSWEQKNLARVSIRNWCIKQNTDKHIENLIVKSTDLLIGHWYLAGAYLDNLILDNEYSEKTYNYVFEDSVTGSWYENVDSYNYRGNPWYIESYIKHIDLGHNDFDNVIISRIGEACLKDCIDLETFPFDRVVSAMGQGAFYNCGFKTLNLNVRILNKEVFRNNIKLLSLTIDNNLSILNEDIVDLTKTFKNCYSLLTITGLERVEEMIQLETFRKCKSLDVDFTIHSFKKLGHFTFAETGITNLHSSTLEKVGNYCFYSTKIKTIKAPHLILNEIIDNEEEYKPIGVFASCTLLTDVIDLVPFANTIPDYTFKSCYRLNSINKYITQNVTTIEDEAFYFTAYGIDSEKFPILSNIKKRAFFNPCIFYTDENNTIQKEIKFLLPETVTQIESETLYNANCIELYGPNVINLFTNRTETSDEEFSFNGNRVREIFYDYCIYLTKYGKINLPTIEEFSVDDDSRKIIYLPATLEEVYFNKLKYLSKNVDFNISGTIDNNPLGIAFPYYPRKIIYAPELTNIDAGIMISDFNHYMNPFYSPLRSKSSTIAMGGSQQLSCFLPKWWQIKNFNRGFYSSCSDFETLVFAGNYASSISIYNSDKLIVAELGGWYHGRMVFENNSVLQTINTNLEVFPLIDPNPIIEENKEIVDGNLIYNSTLIFSNNPSLQEVNFPSQNNPIDLEIDGYHSHSSNCIICRNYDRTTNLQTHTYTLNCNPDLIQSLTLKHISLNGPEFTYINTLSNLKTLRIRTIGDYEESAFTLNNPNIEKLIIEKGKTLTDWENGGYKDITPKKTLQFNIKCKENCTIEINENGGTYILNNDVVENVYNHNKDLVIGNTVNNLYIKTDSYNSTIEMQKIENIYVDHGLSSNRVTIICPSVKTIRSIDNGDIVYLNLISMGYEDLEYVDTFNNQTNTSGVDQNTVWDLDRLIGKQFDTFGAAIYKYIYEGKTDYNSSDNNNILNYIGKKIYTKHLKRNYFGPLDLVITEDTTFVGGYYLSDMWTYEDSSYKYISHIYITREAYDKYFSDTSNKQRYGQRKIDKGYYYTYEDDLSNPYIRCIDDL